MFSPCRKTALPRNTGVASSANSMRRKPLPTKDLTPLREPLARMTAANAKRGPSFQDLATAYGLYKETKKLDWTLHQDLNIPHCRDRFACPICVHYFDHLKQARERHGLRPKERKKSDNTISSDSEDSGIESNTNADKDDDDDDDDVGSQEDEYAEEESQMDPLFRLQDMRGKMRAIDWQDLDTQNDQDAGGFAAAALLHAEAEKKKEEALAQQVALQTRLDMMKIEADDKLRGLQVQYGSALTECDETRRDRDQARVDRDQARADRDQARVDLSAALQEVARLRQQLEDLDSARPRKRPHGGASHPFASNSQAPSPTASEDHLWEKLNRMQRPSATDAPETIAQYLQHHEETDFKGIPTSGPSWIVDMRDVRGYRQVMSRAPPRRKGAPYPEWFYSSRCLARLLNVLAIPGKYESLLCERQAIVAETESLTPCDFGPDPSALSDSDVALLLAQRGLTVEVAGDSWQFCHRYLGAQAAKPDNFVTQDLINLWMAVKDVSPPPGLRSAADDQYVRTVPSKLRKGQRNHIKR